MDDKSPHPNPYLENIEKSAMSREEYLAQTTEALLKLFDNMSSITKALATLNKERGRS